MPQSGKALLIPITLDHERRLCFDFNAFASYEEVTGKSVLRDGLQDDLRSITGIRALLWAALLHEDPELTLRDVGAMLHLGNAQVLSERLSAALEAAMPDAEPEGNAPAAGRSRRDGGTSGR
jgi:hypothetical protein